MEDSNNSNHQFDDDEDQNPIQHTHHPTNPLRKRKHTESQVITSTISTKMNPNSESSVLDDVSLAHTSGYDIHSLPDSLFLEILARLPVNSIFRSKCVCKHWQTLISDPSFCRFYSLRMLTVDRASSFLPFRIFYRYIYMSKFKEVLNRLRPEIYNSSTFSVLFLSSFEEQQQSEQFKVLATSNGLILCCLLGPLIYYVCDPVTRQWVTLPRARGRDISTSHNPIFFGEGFLSKVNQDNLITSFRVVRVEYLCSPSMYLNLEAFSSETGEWVDYRLRCRKPIQLLKRGGGPIHFNGILHWFVHDYGMVAFDPYKDPKSCSLIQFPEDRDVESEYKHDGLYRLCDECQGKLRFFEVYPEDGGFYCFSLWVLKDYEKGEWVSEFKVTRSDLSSNDPELSNMLMRATFVPLSFHPFDLDIVYLRCVELVCIVSYNIKNKRLDIVCRPIGVVEDLSWRVVMPFVLPKWPMPFPVPPIPKKAVTPIRIPIPVHQLRPINVYTCFF